MSFTDYLEDAVLNARFRDGTPHLQVFTADPGEDASGAGSAVGSIEPLSFGNSNDGEITIDTDVTVDGITSLTQVTHWGIWDDLAGTNLLVQDTIKDGSSEDITITVGSSGEITFNAGTIVVALS